MLMLPLDGLGDIIKSSNKPCSIILPFLVLFSFHPGSLILSDVELPGIVDPIAAWRSTGGVTLDIIVEV